MRKDNAPNEKQRKNSQKFIIEVIGDIPYYVPMPENVALSPSMVGAEKFFIEFIHFQPLRHPEDSKGEKIDDRLGTYIRSRARVVFPRTDLPPYDYVDEFERKALAITNRALRTIQYKAYDHTIRHLSGFDSCLIKTIEFNPDGSIKPEIPVSQKSSFGPHGVRPLATLKEEAVKDLWWLFNGLSPIHSAWFLVLDAKYHSAVGDIPRAILDLATGLEINVDGLVDLYEYVDPALTQIEFDEKNIYWKYDKGLSMATGHSLHEEPDLFAKLEYIYAIRNSIAHGWKPKFILTSRMKRRSRYLHFHEPKHGHEITESSEIDNLIKDTEQIIKHSIGLFKSKYGYI